MEEVLFDSAENILTWSVLYAVGAGRKPAHLRVGCVVFPAALPLHWGRVLFRQWPKDRS